MIRQFSTDSEYLPREDDKTLPISVAIKGLNEDAKFYLHPNCPINENDRQHDCFRSPFVPFDYYGIEYREIDLTIKRKRNSHYCRFESFIFYSYKDIEFLFSDEKIYREYVLPHLNKVRRISVRRAIRLPWEVYVNDEKGKFRWMQATYKPIDISAMQGMEGLDNYAKNVGIKLENKHSYTSDEKKRMDLRYIENPEKFEAYNQGDLDLIPIHNKTNEFYNEVATKIGIETKLSWGLSTGKIVASIVTEWLSKESGIPSKELYLLSNQAAPEFITRLSKDLDNQDLKYLAMTDGGRCLRERKPVDYMQDVIKGNLVDIDISSCYGSGLLNQKFVIGKPTITYKPMTLRQFLGKYKKQLVVGLWVARCSYKDAPFNQDLILSKTEEKHTSWFYEKYGNNEGFMQDDGKFVYDATLTLVNKELHQGLIQHDILQVLKNYSSNREYGWLLDNLIVNTSMVYEKKNRIEKVNQKMIESVEHNDPNRCNDWVQIDIKDLMETMIGERKKYAKGESLNEFLKVVINTLYGCTCSEFFSDKQTAISNIVVSNNITARARVLSWCMAKGLYAHMTITDGGVFNVNEVLTFKKTSLNLFERLHENVLNDDSRHYFAFKKSILEIQCDYKKTKELMQSAHRDITTKKPSDTKIIDVLAFQHLKDIFGKLDIFSMNQFTFESKKFYTKLTLHNKVDYRLVNEIENYSEIKLRGMTKIWDETKQKKVINPIANKLFDCIEKGIPFKLETLSYKMLSQKDWDRLDDEKKNILLPHDILKVEKTIYSHTPLAHRPSTLKERKNILKAYGKAKDSKDETIISKVIENDFRSKNMIAA